MQDKSSDFFSGEKISFPITRALTFSLKSIWIRLGRMLIVLMGVASAIAFMTMLFSMATFATSDAQGAGGASAAGEAEEAAEGSSDESVVDPARVVEMLGKETVDSAAVARAFRPWWMVIALGISIAGITNAILMSVTERIKEIGTLKCLGVMSYHIVEIFLFEAVLLGLIGGILGAAAGIGLAVANLALSGGAEAGLHLPTLVEIARTFAAGVTFSILIALAASVAPVVVAARIQPADAMRYEV